MAKRKLNPPTHPHKKKRASKNSAAQHRQPQPRAARTRAALVASTTHGDTFPIVGIGASAGGLEALEEFFRQAPVPSAMAYVVVQHLEPHTPPGVLVDLLQRCTKLPVALVADGEKLLPDRVYVAVPGQDLSILRGVFHLLPPSAATSTTAALPIDFFLRCLSEDQPKRAVAVLLSGMGSDGTLGLRAIRDKGGTTFVQEPSTCRCDAMVRSAMTAGVVDVVAHAGEVPQRILALKHHSVPTARRATDEQSLRSLEKIFVLLRTQTGNDFSLYKRSTLYRRIERRMGLHQLTSPAHYVRFLRENPREIELLFRELLIGVTSFFRDPAAWEALKQEVLPNLLVSRPSGTTLRAWVPGCSTGEEAYSLAMSFKEATAPLAGTKNFNLQIFATDLDRHAIDEARQGRYPASIAADVTPERLQRFFVKESDGYRVAAAIREMVVFAPQNLIMDPPFTKLDLLVCRNLLIYLSAPLQKKLIPLFHYSLTPGGLLFLGSAETIGAFTHLFAALDSKARLYRRLDHPIATVPFDFTLTSPHLSAAPHEALDAATPILPANLQILADRVLVQRFAPVGVLCTDKGDVLYISGRAGKYLEPAVGKANLNVFAMARDGLRYELSAAFAAALRTEAVVTHRHLKVETGGTTQKVDLKVLRLSEPKDLRGTVMIVFADASRQPQAAKAQRLPKMAHTRRIGELEEQLYLAREELMTTREQMQSSQEELKSTNEELQSTNEELQSTIEELTTSKEEMQSLNDELQIVNQELHSKMEELARSNSDMKNLLNSIDIATLFLDEELRVRRFTAPTTQIIKLLPSDAGRPITDLVSNLNYRQLAQDAREVLRTLASIERQVTTGDGRWFSVRIMPYRTIDNVIDGVVLTFTDISSAHLLQQTVQEQAAQLRQLTEALPNLIWSCGADGACDYVSSQWLNYTGVAAAEQLGYGWFEQVHPSDRGRVREAWRALSRDSLSPNPNPLDLEFRLRDAHGAYRWFSVRLAPVRDAQGSVHKWYAAATDIEHLALRLPEHDSTASGGIDPDSNAAP